MNKSQIGNRMKDLHYMNLRESYTNSELSRITNYCAI